MINPNIRMTAEMEVVRMSYYFRTLKKKDYSTGTDEPFYKTFTTHIDKPFDRDGNPVLVEHHIKYNDLYRFIKRYKITRIPDEFKTIYTSYNPTERTMLEMTPSYLFFEENRKHRDFTRGYISQNKDLEDFINHCDKSIVTRNVIIVYEMNFYNNEEIDAKTYKHRYFDIKNDRYNRFNKSWTDGFKIKDMNEPEPKPKIEPEPKPKHKTKKQQQQQKKKLMKQKQKLELKLKLELKQKLELKLKQHQHPEDSDTESDTTEESNTTDESITTEETIDETIDEEIIDEVEPETHKKYSISFNNNQIFTTDDKEEIHYLVSDFCSRNPAFKKTMESYKCLCVVLPIHYDKEYIKQGLHFTAYFYNNKYDRNDTIHIYIENERISHITKRSVETLF